MSDQFPTVAFIAASYGYAMEIVNNVLFIQREIPNVNFPPGVQETLSGACEVLIEAKFDLMSDLSDLNKKWLAVPENVLQTPSFCRTLALLDQSAVILHPVVFSLCEAAKGDARYHLAHVLVAESAVNILNTHGTIPRPNRDVL